MDLWEKLTAFCAASPGGIYRADWDKFWLDTGGYTVNSLVSYGLLDRLKLWIGDKGTYHISMK